MIKSNMFLSSSLSCIAALLFTCLIIFFTLLLASMKAAFIFPKINNRGAGVEGGRGGVTNKNVLGGKMSKN